MSGLNASRLIENLEELPDNLPVSVVINEPPEKMGAPMETFTQITVPKVPNGPAVAVFDSKFVPPTDVKALKRCFKFNSNEFPDEKVRLLRNEDGFKISLVKNDRNEYDFTLLGNLVDGKVIPELFEKYELLQTVDGGTFVSLIFTHAKC